MKICFVMFGSCIDIFLAVRQECKASEDIENNTTFCWRTQVGAALGLFGMIIGGTAALLRGINPKPSRSQLFIEASMAAILCALFAIGLGLITGIGGPGQIVGDLYYASWLAFMASLGATGSCYEEIRKKSSRRTCSDHDSDSILSQERASNSQAPPSSP